MCYTVACQDNYSIFMKEINIEDTKAMMRKGMLEYCVLLTIAKEKIYSSDILKTLKEADLLVVEGTLYPLLNRLKTQKLLDYVWKESKSGPPRKYYMLTAKGKEYLDQLKMTWKSLLESINRLTP